MWTAAAERARVKARLGQVCLGRASWFSPPNLKHTTIDIMLPCGCRVAPVGTEETDCSLKFCEEKKINPNAQSRKVEV